MKAPASPPVSPYLAILVGILAVSVAAIFIRYAGAAGAPALAIATWRLTFATLLLAGPAWLTARGELSSLTRRDLALAAVSGGFLAAHFASWITSLELTSVASSAALVSTYPLFAAVASTLFLRESLPAPGWLGILAAVLGSIIVAFGGATGRGGDSLTGNALALVGAIAGAGYFLVGRALRKKLSLVAYVTLTYGVAAAALLILSLTLRVPLLGYSPAAYALFLLLAAVPQLVGHTSFNYALRYLSATFVAVTVVAEPIGATLLALLLLGERPTAAELLGMALILAGIVLVSRAEQPAASRQPPARTGA